jgi:hypothetical protein
MTSRLLGALLYIAAALTMLGIAFKFAAAREIDWVLVLAALLLLPMAMALWRRR